ncbi:MAG: OsmC family protein [Candidatus Omnitrophica bacterium]|nr:OsmC family protein [Candidatus Omnitrophota bacterium]
MATIIVKNIEGRKFEAIVRNHKIDIDLPKELKGQDTGPTPPEIFVTSFASCIGMYVIFYCERAKISYSGLRIKVDYQHLPDRIGKMVFDISLPSATTEEYKKGVLEWANKCTIHNTLNNIPEIVLNVNK